MSAGSSPVDGQGAYVSGVCPVESCSPMWRGSGAYRIVCETPGCEAVGCDDCMVDDGAGFICDDCRHELATKPRVVGSTP